MKYLKYLSFLLICFLPLKVNALISLNCDDPAKPNTEIFCHISSDRDITQFSTNIGVDTKVTYFGVIAGTSFENKTNNRNLIFSSTNGGTTIAAVKIYVPSNVANNSNFSIQLKDIKYVFKNETKERTQKDLSTTVRVVTRTTAPTTKKPNITVPGNQKTFTVTLDNNNGTNVKTTLSCNTTGSNCNIDLSKVKIPTKVGSTFAGWGNQTTCTTGNKSSYKADSNTTLYACWTTSATTENQKPEEVLYLKSLEIEDHVIEFSKFKFTYDLTVLYEVENLVINAESATEGVKVDIENPETLEVGENKIIIKLASEDGKTSDYVINVKRLKEGEVIRELSSDATLKSISFGSYSVNFFPTVVDYTIEIDSKTTSLPVLAETTDANATFEIEGNTELTDKSLITVTVTAEDGTINTYSFHIAIKKSFITDNIKTIAIAGALLLLLIILLVINKLQKNKKNKKNDKKGTTNKAPTKKVPSTAPKSVIKRAPKTATPNVDPKSKVEVLDL